MTLLNLCVQFGKVRHDCSGLSTVLACQWQPYQEAIEQCRQQKQYPMGWEQTQHYVYWLYRRQTTL